MDGVLAVDIGGTKLAVGIVEETGAVLARLRMPTPRDGDGEALFETLLNLCRQALALAPSAPLAVGIGTGGPMRYPDGVVSPLNIPAWREFPLRQRLAAALHLPCWVDNDAKAVALAEVWRGAAHGTRNMMGMVVSTGVGGGIVLDGRLLHGQRGNAGHIGHVVVWPDGPLCGCGARGCVEAVASGTGIARRVRELAERGEAGSLPPGSTAREVAALARSGDRLAARLMREAGEAVGRGIASSAALLDLEVVAIGGGIALGAWDLIAEPLLQEVRLAARLDFTRDLRVVQAELREDAGLVGAAALAWIGLGRTLLG